MRRPPSPLLVMVVALAAVLGLRELRIRRHLDAIHDWPRVDGLGPG